MLLCYNAPMPSLQLRPLKKQTQKSMLWLTNCSMGMNARSGEMALENLQLWAREQLQKCQLLSPQYAQKVKFGGGGGGGFHVPCSGCKKGT